MDDRNTHQRSEVWSERADDYDAMFVPFSVGVAAAALARLELQPGERFLDMAAGTGAVTLQAAATGAEVVAIDFAEGMLARLRAALARSGIDGVEAHQMEGQRLTFADGSFDAAGSNLGLIFFPDRARGLLELHRVLRPGGRAFVTSLASGEGSSPLASLTFRAILEVAPDFRPNDAPRTVTLATPDEMTTALEDAGFAEARCERTTVPFPVADPAEFWRRWSLRAPPTAWLMAQLPSDLHEAAGRRFVQLFADVEDRDFTTAALIGLGRRAGPAAAP
jgi:ubiquinone/menaquinone biosynthesis C-methylase UbiE